MFNIGNGETIVNVGTCSEGFIVKVRKYDPKLDQFKNGQSVHNDELNNKVVDEEASFLFIDMNLALQFYKSFFYKVDVATYKKIEELFLNHQLCICA